MPYTVADLVKSGEIIEQQEVLSTDVNGYTPAGYIPQTMQGAMALAREQPEKYAVQGSGLDPNSEAGITLAALLLMDRNPESIKDGSAFAKYGITDPAIQQQVVSGSAGFEDFMGQQRTSDRRGAQTGLGLVAAAVGGGLLAGGGLGLGGAGSGATSGAGWVSAEGGTGYLGGAATDAASLAGGSETLFGGAGTDTLAGDVGAGGGNLTEAEIAALEAGDGGTGAGSSMAALTSGEAPILPEGLSAITPAGTPTTTVTTTGGLLGSGAGILGSGISGKDLISGVGLLGSAASLVGAGKVVAGDGTTTTSTVTNTPTPQTQDEIDLIKQSLENAKSQGKINDASVGLIEKQISAWEKGLADEKAKSPSAINEFWALHNNDPAALAKYQRDYGITSTQMAEATGNKADAVALLTGVSLTNAELQDIRNKEISDFQWKQMQQGTKATPEQIDLINQATKAAGDQGDIDINRFLDDTLKRINEEVSVASGLMPGDTPITALGDRASAEAIRQKGNLTATLAGANANAQLNYPVAAATLTNAQGQAAGNLNMASQQFANDLASTAANNRYRLFSNPLQVPNLPNSAANLALGLGNQRYAGGDKTTLSNTPLGLKDYANLASGIGGFMRSGSSLFGGNNG